jgi:AraC-like DNA-binding protein
MRQLPDARSQSEPREALWSSERGLSDWLARVASVFQKLILIARTSHVEPRQLEEQLARVPAPRNAMESLVIRYFIDDCLVAVLKDGGLAQSPAILRHFADVITAVHRRDNPLAELGRALSGACKVNPDTILANTIKDRLEQEIGQRRITARTFATEYRIGRSQLDRLFRERFGVGFHRYLTSMRVKRGLDLVLSGMKVEAAAVCVGYKSKKDFYRAVKEETGSTPGKLRRLFLSSSENTELPSKQGTVFGLT